MSDIDIVKLNREVDTKLSNQETLNSLMQTVFKGLSKQSIRQAMIEGMLRKYTFQDFLDKNVYAIPFKNGYSLVTSIDYARKVGMRSSVIGKSEPVFTYKDDGTIHSCSVTIKRQSPFSNLVGEFTAKVFFDEYSSGKNLWYSKPHTMIAKVAEMHALRMACPEEMSQMYIEEESSADVIKIETDAEDYKDQVDKLKDAKTIDELKAAWDLLPGPARTADVTKLKNERKAELTSDEPPVDLDTIPEITPEASAKEASPEEQEKFIKEQGLDSIPF